MPKQNVEHTNIIDITVGEVTMDTNYGDVFVTLRFPPHQNLHNALINAGFNKTDYTICSPFFNDPAVTYQGKAEPGRILADSHVEKRVPPALWKLLDREIPGFSEGFSLTDRLSMRDILIDGKTEGKRSLSPEGEMRAPLIRWTKNTSTHRIEMEFLIEPSTSLNKTLKDYGFSRSKPRSYAIPDSVASSLMCEKLAQIISAEHSVHDPKGCGP